MRRRYLSLVAILAGALLVGYGYALHHTTLIVRPDLGPDPPPAPTKEEMPQMIELPAEDDWDDDTSDDLTQELEAAAARQKPLNEQWVVVGDGGLIRGAAMGIIVRLPDGRLALTWVGGGRAPTCFT